ncbi:MAG TPA: hypothetical protein DD640_02045 [Clostridiales bacterium]|nr:hypothetical protein [Clostridiales bacterium]
MKRILIIDGQGGGIGKALIEKIRREQLTGCELVAVGTNALATAQMLKAGADTGASGESAVIWNCRHADLIAGPIGIVAAGSLLGELSPSMAEAIGMSPAIKILIPLNKCHLQVAGISDESLPARIDQAVELIRQNLS